MINSNLRRETDKVLTKTTCNNNSNKCYKNKPYFFYDLYGNNLSTNMPFTERERQELISQYENACKGDNHQLTKCCDPNDNRISNMGKFIDEDLKQKYSKVKVTRDKGEITSIYVCNPVGIRQQQLSELEETEESNEQISEEDNQNFKCIGYRKPTNYEMCKLLNATVDPKTGKVSNITPDCFENKCEPSKPDIFASLHGNEDTRVEDLELYNSLIADDPDELKIKLNRIMSVGSNNLDVKKVINRILTHNNNGNSLIHEAILNDKRKCLTYLLTFGNLIDLEKKNLDGNTPLILACLKGFTMIANDLLKMGSEIWKKNNKGDTPLHAAIISGKIDIVRLLLSKGSSVSETNEYFETPLHTSVRCNNKDIDIIRLLIEYGSDLMTRNFKNETILVTLENQKQTQVSEEIRTYLQREYYNRFKTDKDTKKSKKSFQKPDPITIPKSYKELISKFPETNPSTPINENKKLDVDKLDIIYDEDINVPEFKLYRSINTDPVKFNKNGLENFQDYTESTQSMYINKMLIFITFIVLAYIIIIKLC